MTKQFWWVSAYSGIAQLILPLFFPAYSVLPLVFFMCWSIKTFALPRCLWIAFLSGLMIDLFSSHLWIGSHALLFVLTTIVIKQIQSYFHDDHMASFAFLSFLFSLCFTLMSYAFYFILGQKTSPLFSSLFSELLLSPFIDASFAMMSMIFFSQFHRIFQPLTLPYKTHSRRKNYR
ncbi:MAG: rod shape-determining protein MreD [Simkaniaceae bacterium]|nr:rod shape-determining protein MreD [Simkaniaceae bacterium]MCF7851722.1 rod shape-determining protein MreD [Simkaniaceae bacterium]